VFWLTAAFLTLGLPAQRNRAAPLGVPPGAMSLSGAVCVITDLSHPYRGLMAISIGDMRTALARMIARRIGRLQCCGCHATWWALPVALRPAVGPAQPRRQIVDAMETCDTSTPSS
jgi:hypothetical protein